MYTCKPDYEAAQRRVNAFWHRADTDRPLVNLSFMKPGATAFPKKRHATPQDYWLDIEYRAEAEAHRMANTVFYADTMPVVFPNLGPEIFSAWAGCPYTFGETTAWSEPCVDDWAADASRAVADWSHPLFKKTEAFTRLLLDYAKGHFIVGLTDFHPGGDHLAALRDPARLATDLIDQPEAVKAKLKASYDEYFPVYDHFTAMIKEHGMPIATWTPLTSESTMYVPSNDFSCMISTAMFEEFFLEGIIAECRHYGHSIYHLDGPGALRHLDTLLAIPELDAVQWVPGAGNEEVSRWMDVYKRVLAAGKGLQITTAHPRDLDLLMEHLPAKGLWLCMHGADDEDAARAVMKKIERWPH